MGLVITWTPGNMLKLFCNLQEDRSDIEEKVAKIKSKTKKDEEDENILAKKALLADMSDEELEEGESSDDDDNEEEEDSKKSGTCTCIMGLCLLTLPMLRLLPSRGQERKDF